MVCEQRLLLTSCPYLCLSCDSRHASRAGNADSEICAVIYSSNSFIFEDTTALHAFLANISVKNCGTLTNLAVAGWGFSRAHKALNHPAFTLLGSAVNLKRLHIDCRISWGGPQRVATQFYRDGFHWLEAGTHFCELFLPISTVA